MPLPPSSMESAGYDPGIGETPDTDMIYIQNLPLDVTEADIVAHFGSIGVIKFDKKQVHSTAVTATPLPTYLPPLDCLCLVRPAFEQGLA